MIGGQDEDFCGKSGIGETPQELSDRLTGRPRKAKSCMEINRDGTSGPYKLLYPISSSLDSIDSLCLNLFLYRF
ncbi:MULTISPECIES: hypothetical protein [Priestia]|uniref:hypothetical protein n=1 Tax=Priestia TaxID=2800373 RepID=UPI00146FCAA1|nr:MULTISPECIES: hypothetical protein [Priestia]MBX4161096.1 hypothetical protein [Priestia megaterium]